MTPKKIVVSGWSDYELIDCGKGRKLERFGQIVLDRPEINAVCQRGMSASEWSKMTHSKFIQESPNSGVWSKPIDPWEIEYNESMDLILNLEIGQFKHVGVFPEQQSNWNYIYDSLNKMPSPKALNLFAYTGAASLAARRAESEITHVESISQLLSKAKENMLSSELKDIRWMREDVLKYVLKEVKREKKYDMIIMDPPSWGRGPKGEMWKIDKHLDDLISAVSKLLNPRGHLVVNTYSGISPTELKERLDDHLEFRSFELGDLVLRARSGKEFVTGSLFRGKLR